MTSPHPKWLARHRAKRALVLCAVVLIGASIFGGMVVKLWEPGWNASGVVNAPPDHVWQALLNNTAELSDADRRAIAWHAGPQPYVTRAPGTGELRVEVDERRRTVATQGEWWYRGTISVEPYEEGGSLVLYRVENVASGASWWIAQLVQGPSHARELDRTLEKLLEAIRRELGVPARPTER